MDEITFNLKDVIYIFGILLGMVIQFLNQKQKVAMLKQEIETYKAINTKELERIEKDVQAQNQKIDENLKSIEQKLDAHFHKVEKQISKFNDELKELFRSIINKS